MGEEVTERKLQIEIPHRLLEQFNERHRIYGNNEDILKTIENMDFTEIVDFLLTHGHHGNTKVSIVETLPGQTND